MATTTAEAGGGGGGSGDLFGDLWVVVRDLDPTDGGGNGEPVLDENGQIVPIGYDSVTGEIFPIHLVEAAEGDWEVPADLLPYVQEIELERANIIRAPDDVEAAALEEALAKIEAGTEITTDPSGRIAVDGVLIDSPRECMALYNLIMTAGDATSWTEAQANAAANLPAKLVALLDTGWNPVGLLAGVFSKFTPVSMDAVITAHSLGGVNTVTDLGTSVQIDHYSFTDGVTETFDHDRVAAYGDVWIKWYQDIDGDPSDLEAVQRTLLDVVWGSDRNGDGINDVGSGVDWVDEYLQLTADGTGFEMVDGSAAGINDWAQAVEDARAVIYVMHEFIGATEVEAPPVADDILVGTPVADLLTGWGGDDQLFGLQGDDTLEGGDGNDLLVGGLDDDYLEGSSGLDTLRGGAGEDTLRAGEGNDKLFGGDDNDRMTGGTGNDLLDGGDGDDRLDGNRGVDIMTGGLGADLFVFGVAETGVIDTITDFSAVDLDKIVLTGIDAVVATDADDAFIFLGYADFTNTAGELRAVDLGGTQQILGDVDGDGLADFAIDVTGIALAEATWFAL